MLKGNSINPQLNYLLAQTGHTDMVAIVDAGFPIPQNVERVDLAWTKGKPSFEDICTLISQQIVVEKAYLALEIKEKSPEMLQAFERAFPNVEIEFIPHTNFKQMTNKMRAIVRTGEYTSFSNCILVAGVAF